MVALLVLPLVASVSVIGVLGVNRIEAQVSELYQDQYTHTLDAAQLQLSLSAAESAVLQAVLTDENQTRDRLNRRLDRRLFPAVEAALAEANATIGKSGG